MRIVLIAGETSGDLLGASVVRALRAQYPDCECLGVTGPRMREAGCASIGDIVAGMFLGHGVLAALLDVQKTGLGRFIDVAMLDSQLALLEHAIAITSVTGEAPQPSGARGP